MCQIRTTLCFVCRSGLNTLLTLLLFNNVYSTSLLCTSKTGEISTWPYAVDDILGCEEIKRMNSLKGQCHEIFCCRFFSWIIFPQAPENNVMIILNFFANLLRCSQVKVHHRYQRLPAANFPPVSTTPVSICHRYQPAVNLPPVLINCYSYYEKISQYGYLRRI